MTGKTGGPVEPPPCDHSLYAHDHSHIPDEYRFPQRCSGRFWCTRCKRWVAGDKCRLVPAGKAA